LLLLLVAPLVWYNGARREVRPSHQSPIDKRFCNISSYPSNANLAKTVTNFCPKTSSSDRPLIAQSGPIINLAL
ncbi:hypothetical protein, partial [Vibrio sp. 705]|uniref:hypothetical protein n=1 Tax=Vibrio sp. 705 TaxID=3074611 RepID=UPI002963C993